MNFWRYPGSLPVMEATNQLVPDGGLITTTMNCYTGSIVVKCLRSILADTAKELSNPNHEQTRIGGFFGVGWGEVGGGKFDNAQ